MLRTQSTRIQLTAADMEGLDERIFVRRLTEPAPYRSHARLSLGPRLQTRVAAVASGHDYGKQRTVSTESQATLCTGDTLPEDPLSPKIKATDNLQHAAPSSQTAHALKALLRRGSPSGSVDHTLAQSSKAAEYTRESRHRRRQTAPSNHNITGLDGANESAGPSRSSSVVPTPLHAGRPVFQDLPFLSAGSPSTERRLLSSARARRPRMSSHEDPLTIHEDHVFDPNAAVFTPHVRFGSTVTVTDTEAHVAIRTSNLRERTQAGHYSVDLWVRSSSEQNMDISRRHRLQQELSAEQDIEDEEIREPALLSPRHHHGRAASSRQQQSSENSTQPLPSPNLDRYPLLLPTTNSGGRRRSGSNRSDMTQRGETGSRQASRTEDISPPTNTTSPRPDSNRPDSPTLAAVSLSSPVFLRSVSPSPAFNHRSSSQSWRNDSVAISPKTCLGATTSSPASGISQLSGSSINRHASGELADAAAEFLRARSSPLDRLTAELGRLSATLSSQAPGTPSGRSIKLLNGDPFRQYSSASRERTPSAHSTAEHDIAELRGTVPATQYDSKTSPPRAAFEIPPPLPDTPATQPFAPTTRSSDAKATPSLDITTTPAPARSTMTATPKLPVYSDATPAHLQPQTPADLPGAARRLRNRSESAVQQDAIFVGRALTAPAFPPAAVAGRSVFRNTYPSAIATGASSAAVTGDAQRNIQALVAELRQREGEAAENDVEGQLVGLQDDRRVWLGRREEEDEGGLDVTPPAEGRFERYLE